MQPGPGEEREDVGRPTRPTTTFGLGSNCGRRCTVRSMTQSKDLNLFTPPANSSLDQLEDVRPDWGTLGLEQGDGSGIFMQLVHQ